MDENIIQERVKCALDELRKRDAFLLVEDANERSISHKLATYLQRIYEEWDVDCEYNRDHHDPGSYQIKKLVSIMQPG